MDLIDRVAIIVHPKEPYLAWARSIEEDAPPVEVRANDFGTFYLTETGERE
jgi:hypothetical protein